MMRACPQQNATGSWRTPRLESASPYCYHLACGFGRALVVNTNGDAFTQANACLDDGYIGDLFADELLDLLHSSAHDRTIKHRLARAAVCERCRFGRHCSRIPLIEALPSERAYGLIEITG